MFLSMIICLLLIPCCLCESHYSILGVSKNAKVKEIKKAYIKLAQKWHPDKNKGPDAEHMMSKINRAYEILSDEDKKRHYDLLEYEGDDAYTTTSDTTHGSTTGLGEINTREFMEDVLPASETTPYLIYFFHDFCDRCEDWNEILEDMIKDIQLLGIKMASVNIIVSNKVANHCNVYVHEVPQLVLVINRKPHPFKGSLSLDNVKQFIHDQLPSDLIKHVDDVHDILSMESRIKNNKAVVLFVSPQNTPSLNFKMAAFQYQQYLEFYILSSLESENNILQMFNLTEGQEVLLIFSDSIDPIVTLEGNDLNKKNILNALENNKWLSVPRVSSCTILDELCPVGINARSCVLLAADGNEKITEKFRTFALEKNRSNISMGTLDPLQSSVLKSAVSWDHVTDTDVTCNDSGIVARPVLIIRRLSNTKLGYSLLSSYCGTQADNTKILKLLSHSKYTYSAIMATPCSFDRIKPTPTPNRNVSAMQKLTDRVSEELSRLSTTLQQVYNSEKISSSTFILYGLLLIIPYLLWRYSRSALTKRKTQESKLQELIDEIMKMKGLIAGTDSQLQAIPQAVAEVKEGQEEIRILVGETFGSLSRQIEDTIEKIGALNDAQEKIKEQQEEICDLLNIENDEAIDTSVPQRDTNREECDRRNRILKEYIEGHTWYTSQEFHLLRTMIMKPEDVPGWNEHYKKYPLVYDWEWESYGSGKGDLLCTDGENEFLVVELKSLINSGPGSATNHRIGKRKKRRKGEDQAEKFAKAWHDKNPQVKKTTGIFVTNEETKLIITLTTESRSEETVHEQ